MMIHYRVDRMKKSTKVLFAIAAIIILTASFFIWDQYSISQQDIYLDYRIEVTSVNSSSYEIYIPIPGIPHTIKDKEKINSIEKMQTEHGEVYRINSTGNMKIRILEYEERHTIYQDPIPDNYFSFSTQDHTNNEPSRCIFWIFQNSNYNLSLNIHINLDSGHDGYSGTNRLITYTGNISYDWNLIQLNEKGSDWEGTPTFDSYSFFGYPIILILIVCLIVWVIILKIKERSKK